MIALLGRMRWLEVEVKKLLRTSRWATLGVLAAMSAGCAEDPFDFGGPRNCSIAAQNAWVYDLMQEAYLWSDELPTVDPETYESPEALLADLRFSKFDRWSRISDQARTTALFKEGKVVGLGMSTRRNAADDLIVAFVQEGSPADEAGITRGDRVVEVGGFSVAQLDEGDKWREAFGASEPGVDVELTIEASDERSMRSIQLTKDWIELVTVPHHDVYETAEGPVGYLMLSTFVDTAFEELDEAFENFRAAGVQRVVLDFRYNSGGLIAVARHLMDLLVGARASGEIAYGVEYGPGLEGENTRRPLTLAEQSLPDVERVVFVTTGTTLSASELVINAIRPYVDVKLVGDRTGGKPVGSRQWAFCDQVIAPITFRLVNAEGRGDYFEGFEPDCAVPDDFEHEIGDPDEVSLFEALELAQRGSCSGVDWGTEGPAELRRDDDPDRRLGPDLRGIPELRGYF